MDDFDEEYASLSDDPELAFAQFARKKLAELETVYAQWEGEVNNSTFQNAEARLATQVMAFHDAHDLTLIEQPQLKKWSAGFNSNFEEFKDGLEKLVMEIRIRHARRLKPITSFVTVPDALREQIHRHVEKVRTIILNANLRDDKRDDLLKKLQTFAAEVDAARTKLQAWADLTIEVAKTAGAAAKELEPVKDILDSIGNLLGKAGDLMGLPGRKEPKQIEGPKKQLPKPKPDLDDEIPF
jgi:hypothetical protein